MFRILPKTKSKKNWEYWKKRKERKRKKGKGKEERNLRNSNLQAQRNCQTRPWIPILLRESWSDRRKTKSLQTSSERRSFTSPRPSIAGLWSMRRGGRRRGKPIHIYLYWLLSSDTEICPAKLFLFHWRNFRSGV